MKLYFISWPTIACSLIALTMQASSDDATITEKELVRRAQELFHSIVLGDKAPWKKYYADDCLYHDEKGRSMDKAKLVADIAPFPKGYAGSITLKDVQSRITREAAILSYDIDETETIFGQELHARYRQTDTWQHRDGNWQIVASQVCRYYEDPAIGRADTAKFPAYSGSYELSKDSPCRTVSSENGKLFLQKVGGEKVELFPESSDLFFRKGVEGRILFHFGADSKVDSPIDRRNNEDVIWKKVE